jgi:ABC-2 type transport system permease protein
MSLTAIGTTSMGAAAELGQRRGGLRRAYRAERAKLAGQWRTRLAATLCVLAPFVLVAALDAQSTIPYDTLFGRWVHESGFAIPLVVLGFSAQWALPALICVVAGDIFSAEDHLGTWRSILIRGCSRRQIFAAKVLVTFAYAVTMTVLLALSSLIAGLLFVGHQPLVGLSGTLLPAGRCTLLVLMSWASVLPPVLGFAALALLLSIATRSSPIGIGAPVVIGLAMQLSSMANGPDLLRVVLLSTSFMSWHGFITDRPFYGSLAENLIVSAGYLSICLALAYFLAARRDENWS